MKSDEITSQQIESLKNRKEKVCKDLKKLERSKVKNSDSDSWNAKSFMAILAACIVYLFVVVINGIHKGIRYFGHSNSAQEHKN